jgi:hypothetical protein
MCKFVLKSVKMVYYTKVSASDYQRVLYLLRILQVGC